MFDLTDLDIDKLKNDKEVKIKKKIIQTTPQVAIIGMSGKVGSAKNLAEYWDMLQGGEEGFCKISDERRNDIDEYLSARGVKLPIQEERYIKGAHLPNISSFDYKFFSISHQEAEGMDPNQRIFLETAWEALEDAGYASESIQNSNVGIFVGFSSDFGDSYRNFVQVLKPDAPEVAVSGNVKSMISSRLAYQLDLKGPSMLIDTACSSGLVAAYTAVRYIQNGECSMAVVGGVKCDVLPVAADKETGIGIMDIQATSNSDGHTKTFDQNCEGTSTAEGSFAFVFKLLDQALEDGDQIHAVIMGGAINQDGASNGITAPNMNAQSALIEKAIKDAEVDVNKISYIEAHGTATKLGDPIEVKGIQNAYSKLTKRKQFCAIGSVKTNIGHMDNVAGLAGLAKVVLAMKHKVLPASLHFEQPNRNISFVNSPVYVNDRTTEWNKEETVYAGINSFGLSGTNCHLILKSADEYQRDTQQYEIADQEKNYILPLSAKSKESLKKLAERYITYLEENQINLQDMTFTASIGRMHCNYRCCFIFSSKEQLLELLHGFVNEEEKSILRQTIHLGEFRVVSEESDKARIYDITEKEKKLFSEEALALVSNASLVNEAECLMDIAKLYIKGADIPWKLVFRDKDVRRISLPTYPFEKSRCWIEPSYVSEAKKGILYKEQLLESCRRYECVNILRVDKFWELDEHRIHGFSVMPGTGLIEMMIESAASFHLLKGNYQFVNILFENPLVVMDDEEKQVNIIFEEKEEKYSIQILSKSKEGHWEENAQAELVYNEVHMQSNQTISISNIRKGVEIEVVEEKNIDEDKGLIISNRWTESYISGFTNNEMTEFVLEFKLPEEYQKEAEYYYIHPAFMDAIINAVNNIVERNILFLPFSYGKFNVFDKLGSHVIVHFKKRDDFVSGKMYSFDVVIADMEGNILLEIENYKIKSASNIVLSDENSYGYRKTFKRQHENDSAISFKNGNGGNVLIWGDIPTIDSDVKNEIIKMGFQCIIGNHNTTLEEVESWKDIEFEFGLFADCILAGASEDIETWNRSLINPVNHAITFIKAVSEKKLKFKQGISLVTKNAFKVIDEQNEINPGQASLVGLWRVASLEYTDLKLSCKDIDAYTSVKKLVMDIMSNTQNDIMYYRANHTYIEVMEKNTIPIKAHTKLPIVNDVIIISGGTGELGNEIANFFVKNGMKKLILLGSKENNKEIHQWDNLRSACDVFEVVKVRIEDAEEVQSVVQNIREKYGKIAGVFHLAGKAGDGYLYHKEMDEFMRVYLPKAIGMLNLHFATQEEHLEFFVEFSSISSLLLNVGQSDYTAANMVLDSFAEYRRENHMNALSIQWPAWREVGIAKRMHAVDETEEFLPMNTSEALDVLKELLASESLGPVIMPGQKRKVMVNENHSSQKYERNKGKREVTLFGVEYPSELELEVATIWAETLGVTEIDVNDDFNELGGNSLLISQMLKLYEKKYPGLVDITDLFKYTTIAKQVDYLNELLGGTKEEKDLVITNEANIDQLLDMLESGKISIEETKKYLL